MVRIQGVASQTQTSNDTHLYMCTAHTHAHPYVGVFYMQSPREDWRCGSSSRVPPFREEREQPDSMCGFLLRDSDRRACSGAHVEKDKMALSKTSC
jgi:hypothetical protein